jgi:hypothetical protein
VRGVRATTANEEKQYYIFWMCVCNLMYLAWKSACPMLSSVPCLSLQDFFLNTLSHKRQGFRKKVIEHKMFVSICSTTFVWNVSHSKKNWSRYDQKCTLVFKQSTRSSSQVLK